MANNKDNKMLKIRIVKIFPGKLVIKNRKDRYRVYNFRFFIFQNVKQEQDEY